MITLNHQLLSLAISSVLSLTFFKPSIKCDRTLRSASVQISERESSNRGDPFPFGKAKFHVMKMEKEIADSLYAVSDIKNFVFQLYNPDGFWRHEYVLQVWIDRGGTDYEAPPKTLLITIDKTEDIEEKAQIGIYKLSFANFKKIFAPTEGYSYLRFTPSKTPDGKSIFYTVSMAKSNGQPYPFDPNKFGPQNMHPSPPAGFD